MRGLVPQALKILNERFTLTEINPEMIPKSTYEEECFNALVSMKNTQKLSWMELHVKVYQIKRETASELYFSVGQSHFNPIPSFHWKIRKNFYWFLWKNKSTTFTSTVYAFF